MKKNILESILYVFYKCALYFIVAAFTVVLFIQIFYIYEEKKFIEDCVRKGDTQEHCQSIWSEIDAVN